MKPGWVRAGHLARMLCVAVLAVSCAHRYSTERIREGERLSPDGAVYVVVPEAGSFSGKVYEPSGRQTAEAIAKALARHVRRVDIATSRESHEEALASARAGGFDYLVESIIDHWEDRMTEWTGKPDAISVRIAVYRASDGTLLDGARIGGKSRWGTFGGDHPQDLLAVPVGSYVDSLF